MKRYNEKKRKYKTHPIVKSLFALTVMIMLLSIGAAYGMYLYTVSVAAEYSSARAAARYEAYLSLCEEIRRTDGDDATAAAALRGAGESMSRYLLFAEEKPQGGEALRDALLSGTVSRESCERLRAVLDANAKDYDAAVAKAASLAADAVSGMRQRTALGDSDGWDELKERAEVREAKAHAAARSFVGGGVTLTEAENHSFPLVYSYVCENAAVDITRMGGRLLRMWCYRVGDAERKGDGACRCAATEFLRRAGIADAEMVSEEATADEVRYLFCRVTASLSGEVTDEDAAVKITVARGGARVSFFDATDYYKYR